MPLWNKNEIIAKMNAIPKVESVEVKPAPGDCFLEELDLMLKDEQGVDTFVHVRGFDPENENLWRKTESVEIEMVEVTERLSEGNRLLVSKDKNLREVFHAVEDILAEMGFAVVSSEGYF